MKHLSRQLATFLFCLSFSFSSIQGQGNAKVGITYSLNGGTINSSSSVKDGSSHSISDLSAVGVVYLQSINDYLEFETGISYTLGFIETTTADASETNTWNSNISLIDIPIGVRASFADYFFANGGLLLDFSTYNSANIDSPNGIGLMLGGGINYDFSFGVSLFVNPYFKLHSLVPFSVEGITERIFEGGVKFGVTYLL